MEIKIGICEKLVRQNGNESDKNRNIMRMYWSSKTMGMEIQEKLLRQDFNENVLEFKGHGNESDKNRILMRMWSE